MKNADEIAEAIEERASGAAVITACGRPDEPHAVEVIEINEGTSGKRRQTLRETEGVRALAGDKRYGTADAGDGLPQTAPSKCAAIYQWERCKQL
jgi:hypothetical protein